MSLNRIYQGKVTSVEIHENDQWLPMKKEEWQSALWQHHVLFQDAVNYYILALASLATPEHATNRLIKDLRARVSEAWSEFPRSVGGGARSLRQSVANWLKLSDNASVEDAFNVILDGNTSNHAILTQSLGNLLKGLFEKSGDNKIRNDGRQEAPKFFWSETDANFQDEHARKDLARLKLILTLHGLIEGDLKDFGPLDLATKSKRSNRKAAAGGAARKKLAQCLRKLTKASIVPSEISADVIATLEKLPDEKFVGIPAYEAGGDSKEKSVGIPLLLIGRQLDFPNWCIVALRKVLIVPPKWEQKLAEAEEHARSGKDPLEIARGKRGFVFRAFTALSAWNPKSPGEPVWKEFDIAAFKEALKSLNQFNQKTQKRIDDGNNLRGQLAIMLGSEVKGWKPRKTETNEDESVPEPLDPKLFQLARELERDLTQDLADTVVGEEKYAEFGEAAYKYREGEWQLSPASLRGYSDIAEEWNTLRYKLSEKLTPAQIEEVVKKYQREEKNKNSIGAVPLFLRLCEKKYWPLWLAQDENPDEPPSGKSFLHSMILFHTKFRAFERSLSPINLTPAEPKQSRRLYMFSDMTDKTAKTVFGKTDKGGTVECAVAMRTGNGDMKEQRVRLLYSAKRLLRDELQGGVESKWLQPMTRALGLKMPENTEQMAFKSAVSLMPDFVHSTSASKTQELRFLLNFPVTLDPSWIHSGLKKVAIWKGQFNGTHDKNLHLHWPGTINSKGSESPWWKNRQIMERGFTCISVDLGQRTAGAWALLRVTCSDPRKGEKGTKRPAREIGSDGERTWFAEVLSIGILRLPGEDQKIMGSNGKSETERFGKSGRNALESEWKEGKELASAFLAENPEAWMGRSVTEKSFPEQNDALIALANRRLSRLNTFHRWSCFDPDRPEVAERRPSLIKKLVEELEHWQDVEVTNWKKFIEKEYFAVFRSAAGTAFDSLRLKLGEHLVTLANRVAPFRDRSWRWERTGKDAAQGLYGELLDTGDQLTQKPTWLRGQRGLSLLRIEQLENLRRLFLRYNRSFDREAGKPAKFGRADFGRRSGEPCRLLLEKIDQIKEQRVNQTAHLILAEALGVRLREHQIDANEREARDIHGEYEKITGCEPVDFIVIENLDRYLTSQGRAPSENSRLMKWTHRAVRDKIKMLAEEPFGIPVVEAAAAYSSRFCAVTGVAGARCEELARLDEYHRESLERWAKRPPKPGQPSPEIFATLLEQFNELEKLNQELQRVRYRERKTSNSLYTLFIPKQGGPLFLPLHGERSNSTGRMPKQADINAAINIGLRAIAAPNVLEILHKVRTEKGDDGFRPVIKNAREKVTFDSKSIISLDSNASNKLAKSRSPNFFFDARAFDCFDSATLKLADKTIPLSSGVGLWTTVNQVFPRQLVEINKRRLDGWQKRLTNPQISSTKTCC